MPAKVKKGHKGPSAKDVVDFIKACALGNGERCLACEGTVKNYAAQRPSAPSSKSKKGKRT